MQILSVNYDDDKCFGEAEKDALLPDPTDENVLFFRPTVPHRKINQTITSF